MSSWAYAMEAARIGLGAPSMAPWWLRGHVRPRMRPHGTSVGEACTWCLLPRDRLIEQLYGEIAALKEELENFKAEVGDNHPVMQ